MALLVGDVIMAVRGILSDPPQVLAAPSLTAFTPSQLAASNPNLPSGTYSFQFAVLTPWGESNTAGINATTVAVDGSHLPQISGSFPIGATKLRVYFTPTPSVGVWYYIDIPSTQTFPFSITSLPVTVKAPNANNRAYMLDTDGTGFSVYTIYGWLRDGLKLATEQIGVMYDVTGVPTTDNIAMYQLIGDWKRFSHAWVDGWPYDFGNKAGIYYRNKVTTSGSGIVVTDVVSPIRVIEYYPVPDRTAGITTTNASVAATDTSIPGASFGGYELEYGLALISNPSSGQTPEIIAYQLIGSGPNLGGVLRGLGGTQAQAWASGSTVQELNGRFAGYRYPTIPVVGQSLNTLDVPISWDVAIQRYMESRAREAQKYFKEAKDLMDQFSAICRTLKSSNTAMLGPKQTGENYPNEIYNAGLGGGWLLP